MRRDAHRCRVCGGTRGLAVHHIVKREEKPDLAFAPSNLITLCRSHHELAERGPLLF
jgi:5-methylcytosine-specific restriction endonuclease McrA